MPLLLVISFWFVLQSFGRPLRSRGRGCSALFRRWVQPPEADFLWRWSRRTTPDAFASAAYTGNGSADPGEAFRCREAVPPSTLGFLIFQTYPGVGNFIYIILSHGMDIFA